MNHSPIARLICLLSFIFLNMFEAEAQVNIEPGKAFPISSVLSFSNGIEVSLNEPPGLPTIIDLFTSSCVVCFREMPKMNQLQHKYAGQLQVLLIGKEDSLIRDIYQRFASRLQINLPVSFDSLLFQALQIDFVPLYIWLDKSGTVVAVTGHDQLTDANISAFLEGKSPVKNTQGKNVEINQSKSLFSSSFSLYNKSSYPIWPHSLQQYHDRSVFEAKGVGLGELYRLAYFGKCWWRPGDSLYGNTWSPPIILDKDGHTDSILKERYEYSIRVASGSVSSHLPGTFQRDLESFFGFRASVTMMSMPYWALVNIDGSPMRFASKKHASIELMTASRIHIEYSTITRLLLMFSYYQTCPEPFIDETGITGHIDLVLDAAMTDMNDIRKGLQAIGLDLQRKEKWMRVLILQKQ